MTLKPEPTEPEASGANLAANLALVRADIAKAARAAGREPDAVTLIAVSKTHPVEAVEAALKAGQRIFGENRVQEGMAKFPALRERWPDLVLHLIGPLQSNKARDAVRHFDVIQSLDRDSLAEALTREMTKQGKAPLCYVQVNTGEEPQKAGVLPGEADAFIKRMREKFSIPVAGLMCIPPADEPAAPHFALLAKIAARNGIARLSMGMSGDFETAVQLGATEVRVGTAIFGNRPKPGL